jgi:predicted nucleic acid-binding protein
LKKLQLYFDTSVFNFAFAEDAPEERAATLKLIEQVVENRYNVFISEIVTKEIWRAPAEMSRQLIDLIARLKVTNLEITKECLELARKYVQERIVPKKYEDDAMHIAAASVYDMDAIVSWNFKHIVKLKTKRETRGVNILMGYKDIEIISPLEVIYND